MMPCIRIAGSSILSGCIINTASGNASANKASVRAQANTKIDRKVDSTVSRRAAPHGRQHEHRDQHHLHDEVAYAWHTPQDGGDEPGRLARPCTGTGQQFEC